MILSKRNNIKDHCLEVATYLLRSEASSLYISSFTDNEIARMNSIVSKKINKHTTQVQECANITSTFSNF